MLIGAPHLVELRRNATADVLAACDVPMELVAGPEGTGQREAWRRLLFGTIAAIVREPETGLRTRLDPSIAPGFADLRASDLAGRARVYKTLVEAGMETAEAGRVAGSVWNVGEREPLAPATGC